MKNVRIKRIPATLLLLLTLLLAMAGCGGSVSGYDGAGPEPSVQTGAELTGIPDFSGQPLVAIEDNIPTFSEADFTTESFETYSDTDSLGRCGVAYANVGRDLMPTEERGSISHIRPSGWHSVQYAEVDGNSLYNRCHLLGWQLTGEDANEKNLITGTRYLNVEGMLPFENMIADYVKETENHVLYRVTPVFSGSNLVADGVRMEAMSVEDRGEGICFDVYAYNVQPGIEIDYATGDSRLAGSMGERDTADSSGSYVLNTNSCKFHRQDCSSVKDIKEENRENYNGSRSALLEMGYAPCGRCKP